MTFTKCLISARNNCSMYKQGSNYVFSGYDPNYGCNALTEGLTYSQARENVSVFVAINAVKSYLKQLNKFSSIEIEDACYSTAFSRAIEKGSSRDRAISGLKAIWPILCANN